MSSPTPRLGMALVTGTDTIGGVGGLKDKVNAALTKLDNTAGLVMCTSTTRPTTNLFPGIQGYETDTRRRIVNTSGIVGDWRTLGDDNAPSVGNGGIRPIRTVRYYSGATGHSAFPSVVVMRNGTCILVWRQGTDHVTSRDGVIKKATSTNYGRTWSAATTVLSAAAGVDLRDPCISLSRDGTTLYLTWFVGTAALAAGGVYFAKSTDGGANWTTGIRVEAGPYSASSAPCVQLDNGTLVVPWYGRASGDTIDSVWTSKSTDGGANWTATRILNGQTLGVPLQEPVIAMNGQIGVMAYRYGTNQSIGVSTTSDNTANWSGVSEKFTGSGRPTVWYANDDTIACIYRDTSLDDAMMRVSRDGGVSWYSEKLVEKKWSSNTTNGMTYAGVDKLSNGASICVIGNEFTSTTSRIVTTYIGEAGVMTPFGAIPVEESAVANDLDKMVFYTNFDQPDGALVTYPWSVTAGGVTVTNGELTSSSADNVADFAVVYVNSTDQDIEANIRHVGTQSGAGILFRYVSTTTYMLFTLETGGTVWRLYKFVSGTGTVLASATFSEAFTFGTSMKWWVQARGNYIQCGVGRFTISSFKHDASEPGGNSYSTFSTNGRLCGIKLNAQATGSSQNYCRRFVVWR